MNTWTIVSSVIGAVMAILVNLLVFSYGYGRLTMKVDNLINLYITQLQATIKTLSDLIQVHETRISRLEGEMNRRPPD
ncbi:MAG: hypothetical protein M0R06_08140 [Sphaerochaeta sp.]|jgi:hypothetical protein|nr:hypothetical protein [Sphaerochaeta sp.]